MCLIGSLLSCSKEKGVDPSRSPESSYSPQLNAAHFQPHGQVNNQYIRHQVGKTYVYTGRGDEGDEQIEVTLSTEQYEILGITCAIIVEDTRVNGDIIEEEATYVAEDLEGNVWTLGAAVKNFNTSGAIINNHASWISGSDGAKPGIVMLANPQIGMKYRQEYYFNVAENQAEIASTGSSVTTAMGTFHDCLVITEWSELEPDILEHKIYAPGIGLIKEVNLTTGEEIELIDIR